MDVNGTRFHLVLGKDDWLGAGAAPAGAHWNRDQQTLELEPLPVVFPPRRAERPPQPDDRRGAGRDRFGNWYWIADDERGIVVRSHHDSAPLPFWPNEAAEPAPPPALAGDFAPATPPAPPLPRRLRGLAVTREHYLVAGDPNEPGLLVFDLAAGGPPVSLRWPDGVPFSPWDLCAAPDGGVWLLDRDNARLWSLDRLFRVREPHRSPPVFEWPEFTPHLASPPDDAEAHEVVREREGPVTLSAAVDVSSVLGLSAVEALDDGSALLLGHDGTGPVIHRVTLGEGETDRFALAPLLDERPEVLRELPYASEMAYVPGAGSAPGSVAGQLFVVSADGNQAFAFTVSGPPDEPTFEFDHRFFPMRRFGGRALVAAAGEAHYDSEERWISLLEYPRPHFAREAVLQLPARAGAGAAFDGREPGCVWHRLFLDACIPPGSSVRVESRAADTLEELEALAWSDEPVPYLRSTGPELPYRATYPHGPSGQAGTWELLFQRAVGRWLQLRVTVAGNGRITPRLRGLRAYYPRFSYLREYLPAVYREDAGSAWLLDRYLANAEGTFTEVEERIVAAQLLFDTDAVPPEFLEWLASWMGAALDASWSERKRRLFLANAMTMFGGRGTRPGLIRALRLALEEQVGSELFDDHGCPDGSCGRFTVRVVERFLTRSSPGVAYGDVGDLSGPGTTTAALDWTPAQGPGPLHRRWREWLAACYGDIDALKEAWGIGSAQDGDGSPGGVGAAFGLELEPEPQVETDDPDYLSFDDSRLQLPAVTPCHPGKAADWLRFLDQGLGFTYAAPDARGDLAQWRDYLARRYRDPGDLSRAWGLSVADTHASFEEVGYPETLPDHPVRLADWIAFVSDVVPMRRAAHRFTVLVPVAPDDDRETQRRRRDLARRIALLEKPAHTVVETRLYWAAFRVGEARLGTDTLLGQGSRFTALVLDRGELGDSHLGWTEPWNVRGRLVVGRDPVTTRSPRGTPQRWT